MPGGDPVPGVGDLSGIQAGGFVMAAVDNAAFYNEMPIGQAMPDLFLLMGTSMRVIAPGETYCKVELDNGRVGYVMVAQLMAQPKSSGGQPGGTGGGQGGIPPIIDPQLPPIDPGA